MRFEVSDGMVGMSTGRDVEWNGMEWQESKQREKKELWYQVVVMMSDSHW